MGTRAYTHAIVRSRFARIFIIGGIGFLVQTIVFEILGIYLQIFSPSIAVIIGAEAGILTNFYFNNRFSFHDRQSSRSLLLRLLTFHMVVSGSVLLQYLFVLTAEYRTSDRLLINGAYATAVALGFLWNYTFYHLFVWQRSGQEGPLHSLRTYRRIRFFRFIDYFLQLRTLIGFKAASIFAAGYIRNKLYPPQKGKLAELPVGPYTFCFPSFPYFEGLFTEIFLKGTYTLPRTSEPIHIIDCGANIGVSLLYFKIRAPNARVMCFEPNPDARVILEKNIAQNNWGKEVQVFPYALGKEKGSARFFVEQNVATSSGGSTANHLALRGRTLNSYMVEVDTLSHYIDGTVDLLKIDIEGGEFDVLEELVVNHVLQYVSQIQLEYHYIPGFFTRSLSEMRALLESQGFHTSVQSAQEPQQTNDPNSAYMCMISAWR